MSLEVHRGSAWAFQELMLKAKRDIERGDAAPARVLHKTANPAKTHIGWFKRRLLRGEFRKRA